MGRFLSFVGPPFNGATVLVGSNVPDIPGSIVIDQQGCDEDDVEAGKLVSVGARSQGDPRVEVFIDAKWISLSSNK